MVSGARGSRSEDSGGSVLMTPLGSLNRSPLTLSNLFMSYQATNILIRKQAERGISNSAHETLQPRVSYLSLS